MSVRIRRVPPAGILEGVDLRPYAFEQGHAYDVDPYVARVLVLWDYASLEHIHVNPEFGTVSEPNICPRCQATNVLRTRSESIGEFFFCPHCDQIWSHTSAM